MFKMMGILTALMIMMQPHGMAQAQETHGKKIALVMKSLSNPFFLKMKSGGETYAKEKGIPLTVLGVERETDVEQQISIVENLLTDEYDAIVIAPADSKRLVPVCKKAADKGIVVINIDNPFHKETLKAHDIEIPFVGSDNHQGALMVGNYIRKRLDSKGNVIIIEGIEGVENAELRKKGFLDALAKAKEINILASKSANWHKDEAFSVITELLQKFSDVRGILCANDNMALGAVQSLEMLGQAGKIWVGGYDNIEEARQEMRRQRIHATVEQHPELMGAYGVKLAVLALAEEQIPAYTPTPLDLITYESFGKKIGLSLSDIGNPFFKALYTGAKASADLFGVDLLMADAANDDARQLLSIQRLIQDKCDAIIITPPTVENISPAIEIAYGNGIKVITVDRRALKEDMVISHIASDNIAGGRMAGEFIAKQLNGKGNILEIEGIPGTSAAHDRGKGFNDALDKYPGIKISNRVVGYFDQTKAQRAVAQLIKEKKRFDAVFAHNDSMIMGAISAFEAAGDPMPSVFVGFDAIPAALDAVARKRLTATIAQRPEQMGEIAVHNAVLAFRNETLPKTTLVDLELITAQ